MQTRSISKADTINAKNNESIKMTQEINSVIHTGSPITILAKISNKLIDLSPLNNSTKKNRPSNNYATQ